MVICNLLLAAKNGLLVILLTRIAIGLVSFSLIEVRFIHIFGIGLQRGTMDTAILSCAQAREAFRKYVRFCKPETWMQYDPPFYGTV